MPENKLTKKDLEALKQCHSKEEVKKYLSNRQLSEDELDKVSGGGWLDAVWAMILDPNAQDAIDEFFGLEGFIKSGVTGFTGNTASNGGGAVHNGGSANFVETTTDKIYK